MLMKPQHKLPPFDEPSFWETLSRYAKRAGYRIIETCLLLYYVSQKETIPLWVKVLIYSALAYFVMPIDVIPDPLPIGFGDDAAVLSAALASITIYIDESIRRKANETLRQWFDAP